MCCDCSFQLFSDVFVEDPTFVADIAGTVVAKADEKAARQSKKERHVIAIKTMARLLETVTLRHRLLDAAWETEVLSKVCARIINTDTL